MKRALKIAALAVAAVAMLFVAAAVVAYFLVDLDKVANEQAAKAKPALEAKLGRKVEIGAISTRLFPVLGGTVEGIAIGPDAARPEDDRPLLKVARLGFDISLWKALLSGGKDIEITSVYVDGLAANLIRYPDGHLSYQDILDRQPPAEEPGQPAKDEGLSPEVQRYLAGLSIGQIRLAEAEVRLVDYATATGKPAESFVRHFNVRLNDVRLRDPIKVRVDAAVFADATNFELETAVGPLPADLKIEGLPPLSYFKLRVDNVDLSRLAPYLGPAVPARIESALASAHLDVGELSGDKPLDVAGFLSVAGLQFAGGQKFDLRADAKLRLDPAKMSAEIEKLDLKAGTVELNMAGALLDLAGAPRFKDFTVHSTTLDAGALLSYYPAAKASLPPGTRLSGAAKLDVKASGDATRQSVKASVDVGAMDLLIPDTFLKPQGTPLALHVDGDFTADDANLRRLAFVLDELELTAGGTVKNFKKPALDLTLAAKPFSFDRLVRLLPSANQALAASQTTASGRGSLQGHVRGTADSLDALLELALLGVKLDIPGTRLDGDLRFKLAAQGNPQRAFKASLLVDADKAVIDVKDRVHKTASTPALVDLAIERAGDRLDVRKFDLRFAELKLGAVGGFDMAKGTSELKVEMDRLDLEKFAKTVTAIPADKARGGFVDAKLAVRGNPNALETMQLVLDPLDARLGRSDLRGQLKVVNFAKPDVQMRISSNLLDVDELVPPSNPPATKQPDAKAPAQDDPSLKDYRFAGHFDLKRIVVSETDLRDFKGEVRLENGVLTLQDCTFGVFGGVVSAKGTEAEIWKGRMPFKANLTVKGLDVNQALTAKTRYANTLYGKGDFQVALTGQGFETADLEKSLSGQLGAALTEGRFAKASLTQSVAGDLSALEKVPGVSLKSLKGDNTFRNLAGQFQVKDGRMTLTKPMVLNLDGNPVVLSGAIGIAGGLFLQGGYTLSAATVDTLTGGKCKSGEALEIPVAIGGTVTSPHFRPDGKALAATLAARCLKDSAAGVASKLLGDKAPGLLDNVPTSAADADKKAREAADKARAEAEERLAAEKAKLEQARLDAEKKVREEAEKQRKAAEDAAKEKLKEKAGGLLKGLGGK